MTRLLSESRVVEAIRNTPNHGSVMRADQNEQAVKAIRALSDEPVVGAEELAKEISVVRVATICGDPGGPQTLCPGVLTASDAMALATVALARLGQAKQPEYEAAATEFSARAVAVTRYEQATEQWRDACRHHARAIVDAALGKEKPNG